MWTQPHSPLPPVLKIASISSSVLPLVSCAVTPELQPAAQICHSERGTFFFWGLAFYSPAHSNALR